MIEEIKAVLGEAGKVVQQHNLLSTATDEERMATIERHINWWSHTAVPFLDKLEDMEAEAAKPREKDIYSATIGCEGTVLHVEFAVPTGSDVKTRDAAFVAALAQRVEIDYCLVGVMGDASC